jgi:hypothetical protein
MTAFSLYLYAAGLCIMAGEVFLAPHFLLWTLALTVLVAAAGGLMGGEEGGVRRALYGAIFGVVLGLLGWKLMLAIGEGFKHYQGGWIILLLGVMLAGWILLCAYVASPVCMFAYHAVVGMRTAPHFRLHFLCIGMCGAAVLAQSAYFGMNPGVPVARLPLAAFLVYYALILFWLGSLLTPVEGPVGEGLSLGPTARYLVLFGLGAIGFGMVYTILQAHFLYN